MQRDPNNSSRGLVTKDTLTQASLSLASNDNEESLNHVRVLYYATDEALHFEDPYSHVSVKTGDGTIRSMMDLDGKEMLITGSLNGEVLRLTALYVQGKTGEQMVCDNITDYKIAPKSETTGQECTFRKKL